MPPQLPVRHGGVRPVNPADLFAALAGIPRLPDALCVGLPEAFDPAEHGESTADVEYRHRTALNLCAECPALSRCSDWFDSLPARKRPEGVTAGRVFVREVSRTRRSA